MEQFILSFKNNNHNFLFENLSDTLDKSVYLSKVIHIIFLRRLHKQDPNIRTNAGKDKGAFVEELYL